MTAHSDTLAGGCTCGHVRYEMAGPPLVVHGCHCRWCQRQSGGAFAINALIEADRVTLTHGEVHEIMMATPSGAGQRIARCPKCQVAVWSYYLKAGANIRFVKVGTLDDPDRHPPDVHIYTEDKQPWFRLPEGVPAAEKFYDIETVYSAESLARRKALLSRS